MLQLPILPRPIDQYTHPTADFKCRRAPTAAEWEAIRPVFTELYRFQGHTLPRVMQIMQQKHGFGATTKMYKNKIALWGLPKYTKKDDMKRLLKIKRKHESAGRPCVLLLGGFIVDPTALERKSKRALSQKSCTIAEENEDTDGNLLRNTGLQCVELSTSVGVIGEPEIFSLVQRLLYYSTLNIEKYITTYCRDFEDDDYLLSESEWLRTIIAGVGYFIDADFGEGGKLVNHGFSMLTDHCRAKEDAFYVDLDQLAHFIGIWSYYDHSDIVRLLLEYLAELSKLHLTQNHPQRLLLETMLQLRRLEAGVPLRQLTRRIMEASLPKWLPASHPEVLWLDYQRASSDDSFDALAWIGSIDDKEGMTEVRAWFVVHWCSHTSFDDEDWVLSESLWSFYLDHAAEDGNCVLGYIFLAYSQAQLENYDASAQSLQNAYKVYSGLEEVIIEDLHQVLLDRNSVLRWLSSLSSDDHAIVQLQTALRVYANRIARLDEPECMET